MRTDGDRARVEVESEKYPNHVFFFKMIESMNDDHPNKQTDYHIICFAVREWPVGTCSGLHLWVSRIKSEVVYCGQKRNQSAVLMEYQ